MKKIIKRSKTWLLDRFSIAFNAFKISKIPLSIKTLLVHTFGLKFLLACL
ncbi:hypothetical protein KVM92_03565 [Helicobacter pylori]|nr:hypothetical protein KVM92_03565 [Helicobacter pylori]